MKKRTKWRMALFMLLCVLAAFAFLLYLPFGKEGASWGDLPIFGSVVAGCVTLGGLWWALSGFSVARSLLGWLVLAVPLAAHGLTAANLVYERFNGDRNARQVVVQGLSEEPIMWQGFDGPVGMKVTLDVVHPVNLKMLIDPPEIRMAPPVEVPYDNWSSTQTGGSGYFKDTYIDQKTGNVALLKTVLFQKHFEYPAAISEHHKWNASARFDAGGKTKLTYFLMPGIVDYLENENHICLNARVEGLPMCGTGMKPENGCASGNTVRLRDPVYARGKDLTALWYAWPGMDIGPALTRALRDQSKLQSNIEQWTAIQKRLEPAGLISAGYSLCEPGKDSHTAFRVCYCRPVQTDE